jgi:indolepyruvate ferredoxin oxidoreductase alpha subunit
MPKKLLMGNEAIALGAIRAGVKVVCGYPGTPSTEALETVARHNDGSIYVEWSVNEKVALEVGAGAAAAGARTMVTMKQMGLNVAADPLMSLNIIGVKGGMVVVVADDPGPLSSQTEQDTRHYSRFAKVALFDPSTPEEAYTMIADAFQYSEKYGKPVFFRPTTRVCHSYASVEILPPLQGADKPPEGFVKDSKWVIFPKLSYANKFKIEENLSNMREDFASYEKNILTPSQNATRKGIAAGGVSYAYAKEALAMINGDCRLLKVSTFPFPDKLGLEFLKGLDEVLVFEELDPVIEQELFRLCGMHGLSVKVLGKNSGHTQIAGESTVPVLAKAAAAFLGVAAPAEIAATQTNVATSALPENTPPLIMRTPAMCAGCAHRASFFAVKEATKDVKAVYTGDIGCYTLGNAPPLDMVDTCLCMGGGITMAQGLKRAEPDAVHFAFIGDSTFFHSGVTGIINAAYNQTDMVAVILDNSTTAMTGGQPHPGTDITMMGNKTEKMSCEKVARALNVACVIKVNPFDQQAAKDAVKQVLAQKGVRVLIFEALCNNLTQPGEPLTVDINVCNGCGVCDRRLGCPALSMEHKVPSDREGFSHNVQTAVIKPSLCTGCGICKDLCNVNAIKGGENHV